MDMFKLMKEAGAMKQKLSEMEKSLKDKRVEAEYNGIKIISNGKFEILELKLPESISGKSIQDMEKDILRAISEVNKKTQKSIAEETKKMTGGMSIPGLF